MIHPLSPRTLEPWNPRTLFSRGPVSPLHPLRFLGRSQRGLALITVILVVSLLTVVLVEFAYNSRIQLRMTDSFSKQLKAYTLARGGVDAACDLLLYDSKKNQVDFFSTPLSLTDFSGGLPESGTVEEVWSWAAQGTPFSYPVGDGLLVILISDENGKINLNLVEDAKYRRMAAWLFENLIITSPAAENLPAPEALVDSIREWIDGDEELSPDSQGAESTYYQSLSPSYFSKEGLLDSLSELRLIAGFTPRFYQSLLEGAGPEAKNSDALGSPLLTVFPPQVSAARINVNTAPLLVLEALHETITPGIAQEIVDSRQEKPFLTTAEFLNQFIPDPQARLDLQNLIGVKSDTFSISSTGVAGDIAVTIKAVVTRLPSENRVNLLYYRVEG